ncbi:MAG: peptidylprolyl isomerase [Pseudomonadales bacterium]|nr:peptidylprolyl isomerase [Pseudomonadales bacterium]
MLRSIRNNSKGMGAKIIIAGIAIVFTLTGLSTCESKQSFLEVNGEAFEQDQLLLEIQLVRNQMLSRMGDNPDFAQLTEEKLAPMAIDSLTRRSLISQAMTEMSMGVPELMVEKLITGTPNFQVDGRFSIDLLNGFLANQRITLPLLKARIINDLKERQLGSGIALSNFSIPFASDILVDIFNESRDVNWLKLPVVDASKGIVVSDEDILSYYESNQSDYLSEQQVVLEYIELRREDLYEPVSDEQVASEYALQSEQFETSDSRSVAHILLEVNDEQTKEQALEKLAALTLRLNAGEDFSELAKTYSQDDGSAEEGGSLGYTQQDGTYPEAFENAIFSLALNAVSEPVETDAGLHLITVNDIEIVEMPSLDESRAQIIEQIQIRAAQARYVGMLEQAADLAFNAADLNEPAQMLDLEVKTSAAITRNGPVDSSTILLNDERILTAAFSNDVLIDEANSDLVELAPDHSVILRVKELFEPRQLEVAEVSAQISPILLREKASAKLLSLEQAINDDIASGSSLNEAAERVGYRASQSSLSRSTTDVTFELLKAVFEAPRISKEGQEVLSLVSDSGDVYLYSITNVETKDDQSNEEERQLFAEQLQGIAGQQDVVTFMQALESTAEIERF